MRPPKVRRVVLPDDAWEYECEYGFVSVACISLQFAAASARGSCSQFQSSAAWHSRSGRTFNPKVAGSNTARPT